MSAATSGSFDPAYRYAHAGYPLNRETYLGPIVRRQVGIQP
jgi:hypothetical protein